ncbi:xylulokinase [Thorsellia kenyensis]|uniref:Xylulose kinase n=1 Tax=Thorsellia kenyensis TaxID=1549888 RepID=A0ABV6CGD0_9GAMM
MTLYLGVDCGTQSTKVLVLDTQNERILGQASAPHQIISDTNGKREQLAEWWTTAFSEAFNEVLTRNKIDSRRIRAIGISGQQHGFVPLDVDGNVIAPVKLWCDTETVIQNELLIECLGGQSSAFKKLGIIPQTGFTVSKILWFKQKYPELWNKLDKILLPHDYLNYWLTGKLSMEFGDASGTGLLNVIDKKWNLEVLATISSEQDVLALLPQLSEAQKVIGTVSAEIAKKFNLDPSTKVSTGGGDNMMAAIGTGNIEPGITTMSLGTSGTIFTYSDTPVVNQSQSIAQFCSSTNGWLPLICTMNVTSATSSIQELFKKDIEQFNSAISSANPGADGITILPFFNGERTPDLPTAKGSIHGIDLTNLSESNLCRAVIESATYGLKYGIELFIREGIQVEEIRLIGGGSKSQIWREIVANVTGKPVVSVINEEAAALGAAIQAVWCDTFDENLNEFNQLKALTDKYVTLDETSRIFPNKELSESYAKLYQNYLKLLKHNFPEVTV